MPGGFGFVQQPQRPSPDPVKVGMALRQKQLAQAQGARQTYEHQTTHNWLEGKGSIYGDPAEEKALDDRVGRAQAAFDRQREVSKLAALHSGGPGQSGTGSLPAGEPDYDESNDVETNDDAHHSAINAAVADALTRMGNGRLTPPDALPSRASRVQLGRLGVSPFEIQLLNLTGGP